MDSGNERPNEGPPGWGKFPSSIPFVDIGKLLEFIVQGQNRFGNTLNHGQMHHDSDSTGLEFRDVFLRASATGDEALLADLLTGHNRKSIDITWSNEYGLNALHLSVIGGHLDSTKRLLRVEIPVDSRDFMGATPLMFAAYAGDIKIFDLLVRNGALLTGVDLDGRTALFYGVSGRQRFLIKHLLRKVKANCAEYVSQVDAFGISSLGYALNQYDMKIASVLIEHGAAVDVPWRCEASLPDTVLKTPLMYAAECNDLEFLSFCLDRGAEPDKYISRMVSLRQALAAGHSLCPLSARHIHASRRGKTALMYAAENGSLACVDALLRLPRGNRVEINGKDEEGTTPIMYAIRGGNAQVIRLLLERGADPTIRDLYGRNALFMAAIIGTSSVWLYDLLSEHGCQLSDTDLCGRSPIAYAAALGHLPAVRTLIRKMQGNPYAECAMGFNLLFYATLSNDSEMIRYFIKVAEIDTHIQSHGMISSLIIACSHRLSESMDALIESVSGDEIVEHREAVLLPTSTCPPCASGSDMPARNEYSEPLLFPRLPPHLGIKSEASDESDHPCQGPDRSTCGERKGAKDSAKPTSISRSGRPIRATEDPDFVRDPSGCFESLSGHFDGGFVQDPEYPGEVRKGRRHSAGRQQPPHSNATLAPLQGDTSSIRSAGVSQGPNYEGVAEPFKGPISENDRAGEDSDSKSEPTYLHSSSGIADMPWPLVYVTGMGGTSLLDSTGPSSSSSPSSPPRPPVELVTPLPASVIEKQSQGHPPVQFPERVCHSPSKEPASTAHPLERTKSLCIGAYRPPTNSRSPPHL